MKLREKEFWGGADSYSESGAWFRGAAGSNGIDTDITEGRIAVSFCRKN
jgi:hypothetical protein